MTDWPVVPAQVPGQRDCIECSNSWIYCVLRRCT